jgi:hypothetical protein
MFIRSFWEISGSSLFQPRIQPSRSTKTKRVEWMGASGDSRGPEEALTTTLSIWSFGPVRNFHLWRQPAHVFSRPRVIFRIDGDGTSFYPSIFLPKPG